MDHLVPKGSLAEQINSNLQAKKVLIRCKDLKDELEACSDYTLLRFSLIDSYDTISKVAQSIEDQLAEEDPLYDINKEEEENG